MLPELAQISDLWLESKGVRERQFSVGFFDPDYVERCPCAMVEDESGRIIAFANVLARPRARGTVHRPDALSGRRPRVMDFVFTSLFLYGKERGYKRFNMGMAPLSSVGEFGARTRGSGWPTSSSSTGRPGTTSRAFGATRKSSSPEWVPRYMAYQNAWEWPVAIANVSALIAGGWGQVLRGGVGTGGFEPPYDVRLTSYAGPDTVQSRESKAESRFRPQGVGRRRTVVTVRPRP